jgi:outer membrane biosynthesis protein TonB
MLRRLTSLLITSGLVLGTLGASLLPRAVHAQAPAPARPDASTPPATAPAEAPARAPTPTKPPRPAATPRKSAPAEAPAPVVTPEPPPAPAPVQALEYTFLRREDPESDLAQLQQLGAEGWQVVATVEVDGSTRRYVLMRPKR